MSKKLFYELSSTHSKGQGVFATKQFITDEVVMVGEFEDNDVGKNHSHASQVAEFRYAFHGGLISKVNHSCDPNCGIRLNSTGAHDFVAMRSIDAGEEITFDYAMRNFSIEYFPMDCCCGSGKCRGKITGWKDLPISVKVAYSGYVAPYLVDMDAR